MTSRTSISTDRAGRAAADYAHVIGRERTCTELAEPNCANALRALLESPSPVLAEGDSLPPLWHWCYFWDHVPQSELGEDGHPARGEFLPAGDLPRRMWAGSELVWHGPLVLGETWSRRTRIELVTPKEGRSGRLLFVVLQHNVDSGGRHCISERQSIVYRGASSPGVPSSQADGPEAPWRREIAPDPRLLFRYSALTFNSHRIHYDTPYARAMEGYPDLVVHGPLLATLMVDLVARERPGVSLRTFKFRGLAPVFSSRCFRVYGAPGEDRARLWVGTDDGVAMEGSATWYR